MYRKWREDIRCLGVVMIMICLLAGAGSAAAAAESKTTSAASSAPNLSEQEKLDNGLSVTAWVGGWEPDYTRKSYEVMLGYKAIPSLHLYAGGGYADQTYYERTKGYAKGYYFYREYSYLKLYAGYKDYDYPVDPALQAPNPDSNSYDKVPVVEFEVSHWFSKQFRGSVFVEYFQPTFFYDRSSSATNYKVGGEVYYRASAEGLRLLVTYARLQDPDPKKTEIKGRDNLNTPAGVATQTQVAYRTTSLLGSAVGYVSGPWEAEVKYLPNRDLDNSYEHSLLNYVAYRFTSTVKGRADYVYDKYSKDSNYPGKTANVYMLSASLDANRSTTMSAGVKYIDLPTRNDLAGFFSIAVKTGVIF